MDYPLLSKQEVLSTPSKLDNISEEVEKQQRIYGCQLIQRACLLLRLFEKNFFFFFNSL